MGQVRLLLALALLVVTDVAVGQVVECPDPGEVDFADRIKISSFKPGGKVTYQCNDGYVNREDGDISGSITCQDGGQWTDKPVCVPRGCRDPGDVQNAVSNHPTNTASKAGDLVTYHCDPGFGMFGTSAPTSQILCQNDGQWTDKPICYPVASRDCIDPGDVDHAVRTNITSFSTGGIVIYTCNVGYSCATGRTGRITCRSDGQWTDKPRCVHQSGPIGCGNPGDVENASRIPGDFFAVNEVATYHCNPGFTLPGNTATSMQVLCQETGEWTAGPTCTQPNPAA